MASGEHEPRMSRIEDHFDEESGVYDDVIEKIIPGYIEQNEILLDALSLPPGASRVADLGIGTGSLAALVLERYPGVHLVGFDISEGMLAQCADSLAVFADRLELVRADLATVELEGPFDAIISGLAVHHLADDGKRDLFARIHGALVDGGHFVMREVVLGESDAETEAMYAQWRAFIRDHDLDDDQVLEAHEAEDRPAPLSSQLEWMREVGFEDVRVLWQRMNFAVFEGRRGPR